MMSLISSTKFNEWPIPVTAPSKVWVCDDSLAWIAGLNPDGSMNGSSLCCVLSGEGSASG